MSQTLLDPKTGSPDVGTGRWMVVIFNNDQNSMEDVIEVLIRATGCEFQEAYMEMWEAHHFGKAPCHFSSKIDCEEAAVIISAIGVKTEVSPEWND